MMSALPLRVRNLTVEPSKLKTTKGNIIMAWVSSIEAFELLLE